MPGKKKKGGKAKGNKGGGEGKIPPPPKLDDQREGALEAMLKFKITGKEEMVDLYQEEAEVFKEKNYHHKERNYQLKLQQEVHYKTLVQSSRKYEEEQDKAEVVEKDEVEQALTEKLKLARQFAQQLRDMAGRIVELDGYLETEQVELDRWTYFYNETQHRNADYIAAMEQQMKDMAREEEELKSELQAKLEEAKMEITKRSEAYAEKQRELISSKLLESIDGASLGEMRDNTWLHRQIEEAKKALKKIKSEVDSLEFRNLGLMEVMTAAQLEEVEITKELMQLSTRKGTSRIRGAGSTSELPSLVDISKCTFQEGGSGQGGQQMETKLLAVQGSQAPFNLPPETFHLPPIEEQKSAHTALPPRTNWPISYSMLKSVHS